MRITTVAQLDEQTGTVVDQPGLEGLGEQLGIRRLGHFDQPLDLIVAQPALADGIDTPLQLLVLELFTGFGDAFAELAGIGEVGIGQRCLQARVTPEQPIGGQQDHQAKQHGYEEFPHLVPAQCELPSVVIQRFKLTKGAKFMVPRQA